MKLTILLIALLSPATQAATYYIDATCTGCDANNGTAKGTPWQHHPYMHGWTGSYVHNAGDHFIFKGGVTWSNSNFSFVIQAGGASGTPDYYGVDQTWFTGVAWSRPVFDGQSITFADHTSMWTLDGQAWITIDNIEEKNSNCGAIVGGCSFHHCDGCGNVILMNGHDHNVTDSLTGSGVDDNHGEGFEVANNTGPITVINQEVENQEQFGGAHFHGEAFHGITNLINSNIHHTASFCLACPNGGVAYGNVIHDIGPDSDGAYHTNGFYQYGNSSVYNNVVYNFQANAAPFYPQSGNNTEHWVQWVYNNIFYSGADPDLADVVDANSSDDISPGTKGSIYVFGNTIIENSVVEAIRISPVAQTMNVFMAENNFITNSDGVNHICYNVPGCGNATTATVGFNTVLTYASATAAGYTTANLFFPTSIDSATVGAGVSIATLCAAAGLALCYDRLNHLRPGVSGPWDTGAYQKPKANIANARLLARRTAVALEALPPSSVAAAASAANAASTSK